MGARDQDKDALFSKMGVYPATRFDLGMLNLTREGHIGAYDMVILSFVIIELPITFIYETLLFPYDYYEEARDHCNRYDYKDKILKDISITSDSYLGQKYYGNDSIKDMRNRLEVNITQIHQKYNYALVQYNFDNSTEKRLTLFAIKEQDIKTKVEYIYDGVDDNTDFIKNYIKKQSAEEIYDMIDCYK